MKVLKYFMLPAFVLLLSSCGEPTSKERFEKVCGIHIPEGYEVIKDQRVEAGTDYGIEYSLRMKPESINTLTNSIRSSGKYSPIEVQRNDTWMPKDRGYSFYIAKSGVFYKAEVDTITRIIRFHEAG